MDIENAQKEMRIAHLSGASKVFILGLVWITASVFAIYSTIQTSFAIFCIGMISHSAWILVSKLFKRGNNDIRDNPLWILEIESALILLVGLFFFNGFFRVYSYWFFPMMLLMEGARYLIFQTIYGMKIYWILGLILILAGLVGIGSHQKFYTFGIVGGGIQLLFAIGIRQMDKKNSIKRKTHEV